jgi:lipopolysaccharide/colanic/teichoic acid biosynthesis glycosyltransferase
VKHNVAVEAGRRPSPPDSEEGPTERPIYQVLSRVLDLIVAATILVLLSPLWLFIALLIRTTSPGPVLFRGPVIGRGGKPFTYYKFRSMIAGDDVEHRRWLHGFVTRDTPCGDGSFKLVDKRRVTAVGRVLRRLSLDEVPQLLNVLKGDMSVVGPRPPIPYEWELYDADARRRLAVKPGITGLYQVTGRSRVPFSRMLAIDLDYIRRRSLALDLWIMVRTAGTIISGNGAG